MGETFQPLQSPTIYTPETNTHWKQKEDFQGYPFLTLGEAPGSQRKFCSPELCNFFTFCTDIGLKVAYFLPFLWSVHLTNTRAVKGTHWTIISRLQIWVVGVPLSGSLGWGHFLTPPISDTFNPPPQKKNYHRELVENLQDYPFAPWGEAYGSLRII